MPLLRSFVFFAIALLQRFRAYGAGKSLRPDSEVDWDVK